MGRISYQSHSICPPVLDGWTVVDVVPQDHRLISRLDQ
jgi:hypothetical protein